MFNSTDIMLIAILAATILIGVALHWFCAPEDRP